MHTQTHGLFLKLDRETTTKQPITENIEREMKKQNQSILCITCKFWWILDFNWEKNIHSLYWTQRWNPIGFSSIDCKRYRSRNKTEVAVANQLKYTKITKKKQTFNNNQ